MMHADRGRGPGSHSRPWLRLRTVEAVWVISSQDASSLTSRNESTTGIHTCRQTVFSLQPPLLTPSTGRQTADPGRLPSCRKGSLRHTNPFICGSGACLHSAGALTPRRCYTYPQTLSLSQSTASEISVRLSDLSLSQLVTFISACDGSR